MQATETHPNQRAIDGLRAMADFLEANPQTYFTLTSNGGMVYHSTREELAAAVRGVGGVKKEADENYFRCVKAIGPYTLTWFTTRSAVCERVKVGEKVIPATPETIIPAQPEQVIPAQPERVVEVFDWLCPESILADDEPTERMIDPGETIDHDSQQPVSTDEWNQAQLETIAH